MSSAYQIGTQNSSDSVAVSAAFTAIDAALDAITRAQDAAEFFGFPADISTPALAAAEDRLWDALAAARPFMH